MKKPFMFLLAIAVMFGLCAGVPFGVATGADGVTAADIVGSLEVGAVSTGPVTDSEVIDSAFLVMVEFKSGGWGLAGAVALLAFFMRLTKWGRFSSLFDTIPRQYRAFIPATLGIMLGVAEGQLSGTDLVPSLGNGLVIGGGQQLLYEWTKGTGIGKLLDRLPLQKYVTPKRGRR